MLIFKIHSNGEDDSQNTTIIFFSKHTLQEVKTENVNSRVKAKVAVFDIVHN